MLCLGFNTWAGGLQSATWFAGTSQRSASSSLFDVEQQCFGNWRDDWAADATRQFGRRWTSVQPGLCELPFLGSHVANLFRIRFIRCDSSLFYFESVLRGFLLIHSLSSTSFISIVSAVSVSVWIVLKAATVRHEMLLLSNMLQLEDSLWEQRVRCG